MDNNEQIEVETAVEVMGGGEELELLPELYVSVNVVKNSKGVNSDVKYTVRGNMTVEELESLLDQVSDVADRRVKADVARLTLEEGK